MEPVLIKSRLRVAVYLGRFQPFHNGHEKHLMALLENYDYVVGCIGSAQEAHSARNPFDGNTRWHFLRDAATSMGVPGRLGVVKIPDFPGSNREWAAYVRSTVERRITASLPPGASIADVDIYITGTNKDAGKPGLNTSLQFYKEQFPFWHQEMVEPYYDLSATNLRKMYFNGDLDSLRDCVPEYVFREMKALRSTLLQFPDIQKEIRNVA